MLTWGDEMHLYPDLQFYHSFASHNDNWVTDLDYKYATWDNNKNMYTFNPRIVTAVHKLEDAFKAAKGGFTIAYSELNWKAGIALCSTKDRFSRKAGRQAAFERMTSFPDESPALCQIGGALNVILPNVIPGTAMWLLRNRAMEVITSIALDDLLCLDLHFIVEDEK